MNRKKIAEVITELRKSRSMTQDELALKLDISRSSLGMYETGERIPNDETKLKIANFFGMSVDKIFYN